MALKESNKLFESCAHGQWAFVGKKPAGIAYSPQRRLLQQLHGDRLVTWEQLRHSAVPLEADAILIPFVGEHVPGQVSIRTADCLPILVLFEGEVGALLIHAGWRGLHKNIVVKSLKVGELRLGKAAVRLIVGPHIFKESFLIREDIVAQLTNNFEPKLFFNRSILQHYAKDQWRCSLLHFLEWQLKEAGYSNLEIEYVPIDTFAHPAFHSFRRDGNQAGRNELVFAVKGPR